VSSDRDVAAFDRRAPAYDDGPLGRWHLRIVTEVASLAHAACPAPARTLDVGCGTGVLLAALGDHPTAAGGTAPLAASTADATSVAVEATAG